MEALKVKIQRNDSKSEETKLKNEKFRKQYFALHRTHSLNSQQRTKVIAKHFEAPSESNGRRKSTTENKIQVPKKTFSIDETKLSLKNTPITESNSTPSECVYGKSKIPVPLPRTKVSGTVKKTSSTSNPKLKVPANVGSSKRVIIRASPKNSTENIHSLLNSFLPIAEMEKDSKKKRSNSFRSKIRTIFSNKEKDKEKEKKAKDEGQKPKAKKTENAVFADNAQNESFNRQTAQRHSIDAPRRELKKPQMVQHSSNPSTPQVVYGQHVQDVEQRYAAMYINNFQQRRDMFANPSTNLQSHRVQVNMTDLQSNQQHQEDYVCMDKSEDSNERNYINVPRYDSSSSNTIESETSTTSENQVQRSHIERMAVRNKFFNDSTSSRNQAPDVSKGPPHERFECIYGTVYDAKRPQSGSSSVSSVGPRSPSVERTKLTLPMNRQKVELQPRLRSPIPTNEVSTDKLIATELLKNSKKADKEDKKDTRTSSSHQKLELEIDYPSLQRSMKSTKVTGHELESCQRERRPSPEGINPEVTPNSIKEVADWQRIQRDLNQSPALSSHTVSTTVSVHQVEPTQHDVRGEETGRRSSTPVTMRGSTSSLIRTPPKHEIRQNVEAFCWKELKKMKEREEQQLQILISSCGYAEDPIRRSRSMAPTHRNTKRSTSLPREVLRQRRADDIAMQQVQRDTTPMRPIFNRGSLTRQTAVEQPIYSKKVSFHSSQNPRNPISWPTKNGFTQSPPQRRMDGIRSSNDSQDDEVFLASDSIESRNDIFLHNQQKQKELLLAKAANSVAPVPLDSRLSPMGETSVDGVIGDVPAMRPLREAIYGTKCGHIPPESPYGIRMNADAVFTGPPAPRPIDMDSMYRSRINSESPYSPTNPSEDSFVSRRSIESPYGSTSYHESPVAGRTQSESPYGTTTQKDNPYVTRSQNENPYGTRSNMPMKESPSGSLQDSVSSRASSFTDCYVNREPNGHTRMLPNENPYGTRPIPPGMAVRENPYGIRRVGEPIYGSKSSQSSQEVVYVMKQTPEPIYGPNLIRSNGEPIYGPRPMAVNVASPPRAYQAYPSQIYGTRGNPVGMEPIYGSRPNPRTAATSVPRPYGPSRGMPPRHNGPPNISRSNSLRQSQTESMYAARPNFTKPPSGIQQRPVTQVPSPSQVGRYDFPPDSPPRRSTDELICNRRMVSVNQKVCDMFGQIHEGPPPSTPPQAGVLYGQLQRNINAGPMQYQSYQQLQSNKNFVRGTRLTASVNDMHRYNMPVSDNATMAQRSEPPNRPLPPIPDEPSKKQQKSRFIFGRKKTNENGGASSVQQVNGISK